MAPLEIGHLLGDLADHFAARTERFREERVARRAQLRLPDVRGLRLPELRRGVHDRRQSLVDLERAEDRPGLVDPRGLAERPHGAHDVAAGEARRRSQLLAGDLVTDGAGHAVVREPVVPGGARSHRQVREDLALSPSRRSLRCAPSACGTWNTRPESRPRRPGDRAFPVAPPPASTDRAPSWPSSTRASSRRSTRLRRTASAGRCDTPCSRRTS